MVGRLEGRIAPSCVLSARASFLDIVEVVMQCEDRQSIRVVSPRGYRKTFRHDGSLDTALGAVSARRRDDAMPDTVTATAAADQPGARQPCRRAPPHPRSPPPSPAPARRWSAARARYAHVPRAAAAPPSRASRHDTLLP